MRRIDNQIDVLSKTFLGLTLACARCHDHKFDPITTKDYYALAGYLRSSRHQQAFIDPPDRIGKFANGIRDVKKQIAAIMVDAGDQLPQPLRSQAATLFGPAPHRAPRFNSRLEPPKRARANCRRERVFEDFNRDQFDGWFVTGDAFGDRPTRAGDFRLDRDGSSTRLISVAPGLAHSGLVSDRLQGVLRSRSFTIESRYIHFLAAGRGGPDQRRRSTGSRRFARRSTAA